MRGRKSRDSSGVAKKVPLRKLYFGARQKGKDRGERADGHNRRRGVEGERIEEKRSGCSVRLRRLDGCAREKGKESGERVDEDKYMSGEEEKRERKRETVA